MHCRKDIIDNDKIDIQGIINTLPVYPYGFSAIIPIRKLYETFLNNENVEEDIRDIEVSDYVSPVSQIKEVRDKDG